MDCLLGWQALDGGGNESMKYPNRVRIMDVGPRDGLQNEKQLIDASVKIELVHRLQVAGLREIEVTSYVSPKWVPQMADNAQVMAGIVRKTGVRYSVLTPNLKGLEAAVADPKILPDEIVVFGAASEAFSQKNINCSIAESIERFAPVVAAAKAQGIAVRGAMSCTVGCPYEGEVTPERVAYLAGLMRGIGVERVDVADTIGVGTARQVQAAFEAALKHFSLDHVSGHFHDTYGQALANTLAALQMGVWNFQSSAAGLGGCPYAKGATGNVATEDLVYMLRGIGIETGIDLDLLIDAGKFISDVLGRKPNSRAATALLNKRLG
jgi:hydroxymethylglutaryl-CoA lyase